jgi:signal transduction histidine kinase
MENAGSRTIAWRAPSLRGRVTFLAGTVVVLLTVTLLILVLVLSSSQANLVAQSNKHLEAVVRSLADAYETRSDREVSLTTSEFLPAPPAPPAPPGMNPKPPAPTGQGPLSNLTSRVLQDETGIEGGYFRPGNASLVGYAFPTHEGPGDIKVLPARETPTILHVAAAAMRLGKIQHDQFYGAHDVVLFMAAPVCETSSCSGGPVGAAWLMQRLPGAESDRKRAVLWSAFAFGTVACVTMILAFLVLRQVDQGTRAVLDRLARMESDLSGEDPRAPVGLAEFHRVLDGLDRLGATLRSQFEKERELQRKVRQHERLAAIGQLAAGVAHDLRNPLATIRLRAQMAQRRTSDEPVVQAAGVILTEVDRLDAIIERLLDFSRPIRLSPVETDVTEMCSVAASRWRARNDAITYVCEGENHVVTVTDPGRLQQVLDNVIENSVQQLVETKTASAVITMECGQDIGEVWLEIRDNAGGFTKEALKNAAEPFFTTRAKGTGLGLAIGNDIMQALGGSIQLSNSNAGAVVRLVLRRITENEV